MTPSDLAGGADRMSAQPAPVSLSPDLFEAIVALTAEAVLADLRRTDTVASASGQNRNGAAVADMCGISAGEMARVRGSRAARAALMPSPDRGAA